LPAQVTFDEQTQQLEDQIAALEAREKELVELVSHCTMGSRAAGTTCGLAPDEAPDPWLAADGTPCRGYATRSTRQFDFCGYWGSDRNPDAADDELRRDLMDAGPFCRGVDNKIIACSANATRTKRAGVHELKYELRDDRQYWYQRGHSNALTNRDSPSATARRQRVPVLPRPRDARGRGRRRGVPRRAGGAHRALRAHLPDVHRAVHEPDRARAGEHLPLLVRAADAGAVCRLPRVGRGTRY